MCSICGQREGSVPPEVRQAWREAKAEERESRRTAKEERRRQRAEEWEAGADDRERRREELKAATKATAVTIVEQLKQLPGQVDRALRFISGEGNDIVLWFARVVTVVVCAAIPMVVLGVLWNLVRVLAG